MIFVLLGLGCETVGTTLAPWVPALERVDPTWGEEPVDCDMPSEERESPTSTDPTVCYSKKIRCKPGERFIIEGTNIGGRRSFDDDFWQYSECTPQRERYDQAPEAVYLLEMPKHTEAEFRFKSNCANLAPFAFVWDSDSKECPTKSQKPCEMWPLKSDGTRSQWMRVNAINNPLNYLIGVDGLRGQQGNFRLTVICHQYF